MWALVAVAFIICFWKWDIIEYGCVSRIDGKLSVIIVISFINKDVSPQLPHFQHIINLLRASEGYKDRIQNPENTREGRQGEHHHNPLQKSKESCTTAK